MKRKLAFLCCATVLAAMISACGGSSASSSSEAQSKEEPAAQETATEAVVEEDEAEAVDAVEESADAAATEASAETAAEAAAEAAASEDILEATIDYVQKSQAISEIDFASLPELDESKKLDVTEVSEDNPEDKGIVFANGEMYEYAAFLCSESAYTSGYEIVYYDHSSKILKMLLEMVRFDKASGITKNDIRNIDIETIYPGFYSMSCTRAQLYENPDSYDMVVAFTDLDKAANLDEAVREGAISIPGYFYGCKVNALTTVDSFRQTGAKELSDYELTKLNIEP